MLFRSPGLVDIHRRVGAADEGWLAREGVQRISTELDCGAVGGDVHRFDVNVFRCVPHQLIRCVPVRGRSLRNVLLHCVFGRLRDAAVAVQRYIGEVPTTGVLVVIVAKPPTGQADVKEPSPH